jgi:hypothetical protein
MGMDVYGKEPKSETGEYFRRNVWGWRPLWQYVETLHPEIAGLVKYPQSNDGDGLDNADSIKLAALLTVDLNSGETDKYIRSRNHYLSQLEREACKQCHGVGIRTDDIAVEMGMPDKELSPEMAILTGRTHGWCNGCDGEGKVDSFETWYSLDRNDIKQFAEFLTDCGGFEIC